MKKLICHWVQYNLSKVGQYQQNLLKLLNDSGQSIISKVITAVKMYMPFFHVSTCNESTARVFKSNPKLTILKRQRIMKIGMYSIFFCSIRLWKGIKLEGEKTITPS